MIEVVCGIVEARDGRILACRRGLDRHLGGLWEFPGGKVEPGETGEDALIRELREELQIDVEVGTALRSAVEWTDGQVSIRLRGYWCRISDNASPFALEHEELKWCTCDELKTLDWAEADIPLMTEISASFR
ncbi:(deoxy)nucleoside triphosphate pyrophosphohydrolase [Luteolibacter algae]|uniref:8-oxo-dGTP diphosphatase n=1 Tax=Luteolibacter algae TaxID=454151 RepID=A0ABW5D8A7_9BACT